MNLSTTKLQYTTLTSRQGKFCAFRQRKAFLFHKAYYIISFFFVIRHNTSTPYIIFASCMPPSTSASASTLAIIAKTMIMRYIYRITWTHMLNIQSNGAAITYCPNSHSSNAFSEKISISSI